MVMAQTLFACLKLRHGPDCGDRCAGRGWKSADSWSALPEVTAGAEFFPLANGVLDIGGTPTYRQKPAGPLDQAILLCPTP